ncbi:MAG: HEAT repeat domain-containing protein [Burkholderiales bacterium]|nr:HEAT repeat domain-containing protein [Anaerolineae bacterium]
MNEKLFALLQDPDPAWRRRAIIALARSGDVDALRPLAEIVMNDPVPELRELARKAGRHIRRQIDAVASGEPTLIEEIAPTTKAVMQSDDADGDVFIMPANWYLASSERPIQKARWHYSRALDLHLEDRNKRASKELSKALRLDPTMGEETPVANFAALVTGLPRTQALEVLAKRGTSSQRTGRFMKLLAFGLVIFMLALIGGLAFTLLSSGTVERYVTVNRQVQAEAQAEHITASLGSTEYQVIVPAAHAPSGGWRVLVLLHGYGGQAADVLPLFEDAALGEGVLLIAPTIGEYPFPYDRSANRLNEILQQVAAEHPFDERGVVLYGFSSGGDVSAQYARDYPEQTAGVIASGAPEIGAPSSSRAVQYTVIYGEDDELQDYNQNSVTELRDDNQLFAYEVVPDIGHVPTPRDVPLTFELLRDVYSR